MLTESALETLALEELQAQGWQVLYGPFIAPGEANAERASYQEVVLATRLRAALARINPGLTPDALEQAARTAERITGPNGLAANAAFHTLLVEGVRVPYFHAGEERAHLVRLIDFENPAQNEYLAINQYTITEASHTKRPDILLFVNGLPLGLLELKNPADPKADTAAAFRQVQTYKATIPSLFAYNGVVVVSDGLQARAGSHTADFSRYLAWRTADGRTEAHRHTSELETLIRGMLHPATLLDLVRNFTVFEKSKHEDADGTIQIRTEKKIAAYHQYYAVNKALESTLRATTWGKEEHTRPGIAAEEPTAYGLPTVKDQPPGDRRAGVVWHTQGSGKSLSMVFYAAKAVQALHNPTLVVITDRNDLDEQLFGTFAAATQLLRQEPVQATSREHLKTLLRVEAGGIVFTTIQKFLPEGERNEFDLLSQRGNIIVIADEAHRTQYGFAARERKVKDGEGNQIGSRIVYGFAKYMRDALPNATYIGFTGTPIENTDVNTPAIFGQYIDVYDISRAVTDGATVRIYYENRLAKVNLSDEAQELLETLDRELEEQEESQAQAEKLKWTRLEAVVGHRERIQNIAADIVSHFEARQEVFQGKGMVVAMSRRIAVRLYDEIVKLRPQWHSPELDKGALKIVMTASSADGPEMAAHHTTKAQRERLAERMKNPDDELKLVIVRDMWLTGFDAPSLHTLYIDKPMKGHSLMQAIARVNRVFKDKPGGLVVDYLGIATNLKKALSFYTTSGGKGNPAETQQLAVEELLAKLEVVRHFFHGFNSELYFTGSTSEKLSTILAASDFVAENPQEKTRFLNEVLALGKVFALAVPTPEAMEAKDEVAFYQAVRARLVKFEPTGSGRSNVEIETAIRQIIDKSLVSDGVIDVFDAAGIKKPDISILSDEFLAEVKGMKHKNLALELLRKIISDQIQSHSLRNLVQSRKLAEMLENAVRRYQNNLLSTAEIIQELVDLAKELKDAEKRGEQLGLSDDELAFYDALEVNDSAVSVLGDSQLRIIARELCEKVRANTSIDWTVKESARAKLMVLVRRTLSKYGYPPDKQAKAIETVLEQARLLADAVTN